MRPSQRRIWIGLIAVIALVIITLVSAPSRGGGGQQGSTYGRSPAGYGAWYATMQQRPETKVRRWQKPISRLLDNPPSDRLTLLQIGDGLNILNPDEPLAEWVAKGNVLIRLGARAPVTDASFTRFLNHPAGIVMVETRRRNADSDGILTDEHGAVVWQQAIGNGQLIYASTPYLAANAYQERAGNFALLTDIVTKPGLPIWVDEFLHGYKDPDVIQAETEGGNLLAYLARTPLSLLALQAGIILLLSFWGQRRMGSPIAVSNPAVDNSEAYITAMAQVLRKAECSEFVVDTIGKAERQEIQKALGLGVDPVPSEQIVTAWTQQTKHPASELNTVLKLADKPRRLDEVKLQQWLQLVQKVRRWLPNSSTGVSRL